MARFNLLGNLLSGRNPKDTAQSRTNVYLDIKPGGDKANVVAYSLPGLDPWAAGEGLPIRGMIPCAHTQSGLAVVMNRDAGGGEEEPIIRVYWGDSADYDEVALDAAAAAPIDASPVILAWGASAAAENQIVVALGTADILVYDVPTNAVSSPTTTWTDTVDWVAFLDGRFVVPGNQASYPGRFYWSGLYDATDWDGLNYATAEAYADKLTRGIVHRGVLVLFGETTTEFWSGTGDQNQPYASVAGTASKFGLSPNDLHSVQILGGQLLFVATMPNGTRAVCILNGYEATPVSSPDLEYRLATEHNGQPSASAAFRVSGHDFYLLNFESASYVYDLTSGVWSLWQSPGRGRAQITCAAPFTATSSLDSGTVIPGYVDDTIWRMWKPVAAITAVRYDGETVPPDSWIGIPNAGQVEILGGWFDVTADTVSRATTTETLTWVSGFTFQASSTDFTSMTGLEVRDVSQPSATYASNTVTITAPLAPKVYMHGIYDGVELEQQTVNTGGFSYACYPSSLLPDTPISLRLIYWDTSTDPWTKYTDELPIPSNYNYSTGRFTLTSLQGATVTASVTRTTVNHDQPCTYVDGSTWHVDDESDWYMVNDISVNGDVGAAFTYNRTARTITIGLFPGNKVSMDYIGAFSASDTLVLAGSLDGNLYSLNPASGREPNPSGAMTDVSREIIMPHLFDGDGWAKVLVPRLRIEADMDALPLGVAAIAEDADTIQAIGFAGSDTVVVDDFTNPTPEQSLRVLYTGPSSSGTSRGTYAGAFGGVRRLVLHEFGGAGGDSQDSNIVVGAGNGLAIFSSPAVYALADVIWDGGVGSGATVSPTGLGAVNMTQGSATKARVEFYSSLAPESSGELKLTLWAGGSSATVAKTAADAVGSGIFPGGGADEIMYIEFPFSAFTGLDVTQVGAIRLRWDPNGVSGSSCFLNSIDFGDGSTGFAMVA